MVERPDPQDHATSRRPASSFLSRVSPKSGKDNLQPVKAPPPPPPAIRLRSNPLISFGSNLLTIMLIAAAAAGGLVWWVKHQIDADGPLAADKVLVVRGGAYDIAEQLEQEGVITNKYLFLANAMTQGGNDLKAGEYLFKQQSSLSEVIQTLVRGRRILHSVTIPEGLTSEQVIARLNAHDLLRGEIRETPREGSLLPDTYKFERDTPRSIILRQMQQAQQKAIDEIWRRRAADIPIKNPQDLITLASIVEKETGRADERPRVAGVFINRLQKRMKLQSDPTIVYGLVQGKGTLGRPILKAEIDKATPYNTYVIEGLPPGPIANPGRAALEAVANPSRTKELFFVADGTGGHAFAESIDQHQRNVQRWRQIEKAKADTAKPVDRIEQADEPAPPAAGTPPPAIGKRRSDVRPPLEAAGDPLKPATDQPPLARSAAPAALGFAAPAPAPGAFRRGITDAVEGTPKDPLLNKTFDLTNPQKVPALR